MASDAVVGWDIGGAHLKAAVVDGRGAVIALSQEPCPMWEGLSRLKQAFDRVLDAIGRPDASHAVTMTGELVDLFADRGEGVRRILAVAGQCLAGQELSVFAGPDGVFLRTLGDADIDRVASANWLATAIMCAQAVGSGLLVDVGSTTTDLLVFDGGRVRTEALTDRDRLRSGEMVYTGVVRTPVMAIADRVPFEGDWMDLMSEHFATMADVYRLCGELPERADRLPAADRGEKSVEGSARRLARMVGTDLHVSSPAGLKRLALYLRECQLQRLYQAYARQMSRGVLDASVPLVAAGVGTFLVEVLAERFGRSLRVFGSLVCDERRARGIEIGDCAPAVAVAWLLARQLRG